MTLTDRELALRYAPIIHFDEKETIPLRAIGYTVFRETKKSASFPKRAVEVPAGAQCVIEYAYYYDYDIGHMYDLEHIWVTVGKDGHLAASEASFHGKYLVLLVPGCRALWSQRTNGSTLFASRGSTLSCRWAICSAWCPSGTNAVMGERAGRYSSAAPSARGSRPRGNPCMRLPSWMTGTASGI